MIVDWSMLSAHHCRRQTPTHWQRRGADDLVQLANLRAWTSDQAGAGVSDRLAAAVAELLAVVGDLNAVHCELPVAHSSDVRVREVALVVFRVRTAEDDLTADLAVWVTVQVEAEHRVNETLLDHVVEHRHDAIDRDGWEAETEDTVEFGSNERDSRLLQGLRERLVLDVSAGDRDGVGGQEAGHRAGTVADLELGAIRLVGGRFGAVVLVVQKAGDVGERTFLRWHPQVAGAGVEDHFERLRRSACGGANELEKLSGPRESLCEREQNTSATLMVSEHTYRSR